MTIESGHEIWRGEERVSSRCHLVDGSGTNFALYSAEHAERFELCLFDEDGIETRMRGARARRASTHHVLPARRRARPALRLSGARAVGSAGGGHADSIRTKLLVDPYAQGDRWNEVDWSGPVFGHNRLGTSGAASTNGTARPAMPRSVVVDT